MLSTCELTAYPGMHVEVKCIAVDPSHPLHWYAALALMLLLQQTIRAGFCHASGCVPKIWKRQGPCESRNSNAGPHPPSLFILDNQLLL